MGENWELKLINLANKHRNTRLSNLFPLIHKIITHNSDFVVFLLFVTYLALDPANICTSTALPHNQPPRRSYRIAPIGGLSNLTSPTTLLYHHQQYTTLLHAKHTQPAQSPQSLRPRTNPTLSRSGGITELPPDYWLHEPTNRHPTEHHFPPVGTTVLRSSATDYSSILRNIIDLPLLR